MITKKTTPKAIQTPILIKCFGEYNLITADVLEKIYKPKI